MERCVSACGRGGWWSVQRLNERTDRQTDTQQIIFVFFLLLLNKTPPKMAPAKKKKLSPDDSKGNTLTHTERPLDNSSTTDTRKQTDTHTHTRSPLMRNKILFLLLFFFVNEWATGASRCTALLKRRNSFVKNKMSRFACVEYCCYSQGGW